MDVVASARRASICMRIQGVSLMRVPRGYGARGNRCYGRSLISLGGQWLSTGGSCLFRKVFFSSCECDVLFENIKYEIMISKKKFYIDIEWIDRSLLD